MRIIELLETINFKDDEFVKPVGDEGKREIAFDVPEDIIFYMRNDDNAFRNHLYPVIAKCLDLISSNKKTHPSLFADAVKECYNSYISEYPIRELGKSIDKQHHKDTCIKLHDEVIDEINNGKYD
jgi:hypothetical protein